MMPQKKREEVERVYSRIQQADNWTLGTENKKHILIEFYFN